MPLSPVLEAYFGGQKQQSDLIGMAKDIQDAALRRQQTAQELQQRQQTIDEIAKQHGIENDKAQKQLELSNRIAEDTHQYHLNEASNNLIQQLRDMNIAPSEGTNIPLQNPPTQTIGGVQVPINGSQGLTQFQPNPVQHITLPSGETVAVPAWKTNAQLAAENLPIETAKYNATIGNTKDLQMQAQLERLQDSLNNKDAQNNLQRDLEQRISDNRLQTMLNAKDMEWQRFLLQSGLPLNPDDLSKTVAGYAADEMTGKGTGNPRAAYGPVIGAQVEKAINASGGRVMPSTVRDATSGLANDASYALTKLNQLQNSVPIPTNLVGKLSNVAATKLGIDGLSPYKSIYDTAITDVVPRMDLALGFTSGTLSRNPKLYDKIKGIAPLPGDSADVVNGKLNNAADIFLTSIQKKLSGYNAEQRARIWKDITNDHPELVHDKNGQVSSIGKALFNAGNTGTYTSGNGYSTFLNLGGQ